MDINAINIEPEMRDLINPIPDYHKPIVKTDTVELTYTSYLSTVPGIKESIVQGLNTPTEECAENIEW